MEGAFVVIGRIPVEAAILESIKALAKKRKEKEYASLLEYLTNNKEQIHRIADATLIAYRTGEEGWYISYNLSDPMVKKAMQTVHLDLMLALGQK